VSGGRGRRGGRRIKRLSNRVGAILMKDAFPMTLDNPNRCRVSETAATLEGLERKLDRKGLDIRKDVILIWLPDPRVTWIFNTVGIMPRHASGHGNRHGRRSGSRRVPLGEPFVTVASAGAGTVSVRPLGIRRDVRKK